MVLGVIAVRVLYLFIDAHFVEAEVCRDLDVENSYAKIDGS
jgi:prophage antirepressor-like protein